MFKNEAWKKCIKTGLLLCIVMLLSGWSGCGGEEESDEPEGNHTVLITNWLEIGYSETRIDIYFDDALRKSYLGYSSSVSISGISNGEHSLGVDASPDQGTMFYREVDMTFSGSGGLYSLWVDEDGIHRYE